MALLTPPPLIPSPPHSLPLLPPRSFLLPSRFLTRFPPFPLLRISRGRHFVVTRSFHQEVIVDSHLAIADDEQHLAQDDSLADRNHSVAVLDAGSKIDTEVSDVGTSDSESVPHLVTFPSLQVQSLEEQEALAATPAHPEGLYALYASFFAGNFVEQVWNFAWPSAVALLHDSLLPVAVVSFVSKLVIFIGGPWVGAKMDSLPRVFAFNVLSIVQTVAQLISAGAIIYALQRPAISVNAASTLFHQPWFLILVTMQAIERLTGLASGVAFERDWVVLLAGANRPIALADANAMLCRVDLLCEMAGTSFYGILLSKYDPAACLRLTVAVMFGSLPVLIFLVHWTNILSKNVLDRSKLFRVRELSGSSSATPEKCPRQPELGSLQMFKRGWSEYLSQPALPASLAAVFLYFNIGLAPGSLMTSFLTQKGLNPSIIGAFSGMGALMGFGATFLSAALVRRFGILRAGAAGLVLQAFLLAVAVSIYWSNSLSHPNSLIFFLVAIILSRLGHFTYDIVGGQILQTAVRQSQANTVGTTELSLASLAELVMLGVAIVANDVSHFGSLAALSMAAVIGAATLYYRWMSHISQESSFNFSLNNL